MLPHYSLCIGWKSPSPHSQFSSSPLPPIPIRSTCAASSFHLPSLVIDSRIESLGYWGREGAGSRNLGQSVASSCDSHGYKHLSTVELGLQVVCLCQRFDAALPNSQYPTARLSLFRPYVVFAQCNKFQQHAHHFWLAFVCTISPLIPNAILTRLSV